MNPRLTRILLRAAQRKAEHELEIALGQRSVGDAESRDRIEAAQRTLAAVRADLARVEAAMQVQSPFEGSLKPLASMPSHHVIPSGKA